MVRIFSFILICFTAFGIMPLGARAVETVELQRSLYAAFRMYSPVSQDHFYTANSEEMEKAKSAGYILEATYTFLSSRQLLQNQSPLYRLWNPKLQHHFYTDNNDELAAAVTKQGFILEGTLGFLAADTVDLSGWPVYRLYQPATGDHLYTLSLPEWVAAQAAGYRDEGTLFGRFYMQ